jgi:DNA polymerase III alpha subunit
VDVNASDAAATLESGAVRLGVASVRTLGADVAARLAAGRPYSSMEDAARRAELTRAQLEALATAGAFRSVSGSRRQALWSAGAVAQAGPDRLPGIVVGAASPALPGMTEMEETAADETGLINVICSREVWGRHRRVARAAAALVVGGRLERYDGVINIVADRIEVLQVAARTTSRDFR